MPPIGFVHLELLCHLFGNISSATVYQLFLNNEDLQKIYTTAIDSNKKRFILKRETEACLLSVFLVGDNHSLFLAAEAADMLIRAVPHYWVPLQECLERVPPEHRNAIDVAGHSRVSAILNQAIQLSSYANSSDIFVRRDNRNCEFELPPCEVSHTSFRLGPKKVLKLAFSLPCEFRSQREAQWNVFPSVKRWIENDLAFSFSALVKMYPEIIEVNWEKDVRSIVRKQYPDISPETGLEYTAEAESEFCTKIAASPELEHLLHMASEPSSKFFQPYKCTEKVKVRVGWKKKLLDRVQNPFTDHEILEMIRERVPEMECVPLVQVTADIRNISSVVQDKVKHALLSRHQGSIVKLIRKYPNCGFSMEQQPKEDKRLQYILSRQPASPEERGNIFLDPQILLEAIISCFDTGRKSMAISNLFERLPDGAKKSLRTKGIQKFFMAYPKNIRVCGQVVVLLCSTIQQNNTSTGSR